jgi:hypothetical protein
VIVALGVVHVIVTLLAAVTAGLVLSTVTVTLDVAVQPFAAVPVTVYVVVVVGVAVGLATVEELKPVIGLHI